MRCFAFLALGCLAVFALAGCRAEAPSSVPADTAVPDSSASSARSAGPPGDCFVVALDSVAAYVRPSEEADRFGTLFPGDSVFVGGRTEAGWLGFAPGTAQAANVGPFRYRYVAPGAPVRLAGAGCDALPRLPTLPPRTCFLMAMGETPVYAAPDTASALAGVLAAEEYAEVAERTAEGWARVRLGDGTGWVDPAHGNFSGDCGAADAP